MKIACSLESLELKESVSYQAVLVVVVVVGLVVVVVVVVLVIVVVVVICWELSESVSSLRLAA